MTDRPDSLGYEAIKLADIAGVELYEWQRSILVEAMRVDRHGAWLYTTVALALPRQNGKGEILQARELYGGVVLAERMLHTAQRAPTNTRAFVRAEKRIAGSPLADYVTKYRYGHGEEQIEFAGGGGDVGLFYRSRTGSSSNRGIDDVALVVFDEAQHLETEQLAAMTPTLAAAEHPQRWFAGSGGLATSKAWHAMRADAMRACGGGHGLIVSADLDARTLWVEYTAETITVDADGQLDIVAPDMTDPAAWAVANPAAEHFSPSFLSDQFALFARVDDLAKFGREHLSMWDPLPGAGSTGQAKLSLDAWAAAAAEPGSAIVHGLVFAVSMGDAGRVAVAAAGRRADGVIHVELLRVSTGARWLADWLTERVGKNRPVVVGLTPTPGSRSVEPTVARVCAERSTKTQTLTGATWAAACESFARSIADQSVRHLHNVETANAVKAARVASYGTAGGWRWSAPTGADLAALEAVTAAAHLAAAVPARRSAYADPNVGLMVV